MTTTIIGRIAALLMVAVLGGIIGAAATQRDDPSPLLSALDIGFAQDMSAHHQQAITLSDMLTADAAGDVRALAEQIRFTQLNEIGQMTGWLQLAGAAPSSATPMAWMHGHHDHTMLAAAMPGMATPADLIRLQRATGTANETLYLQLMLRHHQGGIDMAAHAAQHTSTDIVRRAAALMVADQTQEIQIMTIMLTQRRARPLSYP
ncbi:hypothetical protein A5699_17525 [Mycobacterium sp. E802]|uniref:DUF305 domain-containing protein n=1 Tax=Mycobacterium sp. E802 TaxID=1834152 RepID=UPI0007FCE87D|nr:DUF305 domain-containing protein [Mycobacterium sp. E802]OBG88378.1 hypothetical protein A5699_17525 [Mycobacterium sp. E802]